MDIRLLIGSGDKCVREALISELNRQFGTSAACSTAALGAVVASAARDHPAVLLLDNAPARGDIFEMLADVRRVSPATRTLMLFDPCDEFAIVESIRAGACGCLSRAHDLPRLGEAIRAVHAGETWFGQSALVQAIRSLIGFSHAAGLVDNGTLTAREGEILHLIGSGLSNKEVARRLAISDNTVKTHLHHIYVKLHQSGRYKAFLSRLGARTAANGAARTPADSSPSASS